MNAGYLHPLYIQSLGEFGTPYALPESGGWLLERPITGSDYADAMGGYPIFSCQDWSQLYEDLQALNGKLVSVAVVIDPFGQYDNDALTRCFPDVFIPFKKHYIVQLAGTPLDGVKTRHRDYAIQALRSLDVEMIADPPSALDEWVTLYANLVQRHQIRGMQAFSREAFACQLQVPGLVGFRACYQGKTVGMLWVYVQGEVAYAHLNALNDQGYELRAAYALHWAAIEHLAHRANWLDLGGGAGLQCHGRDGLSQFKRGWTQETRTAYFGGRIINHQQYAALIQAQNLGHTSYFPAYRKGEFG